MRKFKHLVKLTLIPWAFPICRMYSSGDTMNTSILPRILALYGQNKHHICCSTCLIFFLPFVDTQVFRHSTQFFCRILRNKQTCIRVCQNIQSLAVDQVLMINGTMENWTLEEVSKLLEKKRGTPGG